MSGCVSRAGEPLAERIANLEPQAYQEFAGHFGPRFRALFLYKGLSPTDAEDLAATCITDILMKIPRFRVLPGGGFRAWVFVLARHALADWYRTQHPTVPLTLGRAGREPFGADPFADTEAVLAVQEAVARLPASQQAVVQLRYLGSPSSYQEIASQLGITEEAARVRHTRAVRRLRRLLESDPRIEKRLNPRRRARMEDNE